MIRRRVWGMALAALFFAATSYAGELVQAQAIRYYNEGVKAQKSGDLDAARTAYQKAIMLAEGARKDIIKAIYNNYGIMSIDNGNWEAAAEAFSAALKLDSQYKEANFNMGILYAKMGNAEKALVYWSKALNRPNSFILEEEKPE